MAFTLWTIDTPLGHVLNTNNEDVFNKIWQSDINGSYNAKVYTKLNISRNFCTVLVIHDANNNIIASGSLENKLY